MDIAVLIKYVPDTTAKISISGGRVDESNVSKWSISPFDEYALEAALGMKEANGAKVTAITCGPSRSEKGLRDAAAVGADALVHITVEDLMSLDSIMIQGLLAEAVKRIGADVVFCGKQAADTNSGSTGPGIASMMGAACVGMVSEVMVEGDSFSALRASSSGNERVSVSRPCLFAFDKAPTELRRPNVKGIMMAKRKVIETVSASDLGIDMGESQVIIESHDSPPEKPPGQKFEGADSVQTVVLKLREEANVI